MMQFLLQFVMVTAFPLLSTAGGSFKLCHFETGHTLVLERGGQYVSGTGLMVLYKKGSGIVWYVDETSGALKTQINHLCVRQRQDKKGQMELTDCDGTNDWRLNCPNNCSTVDDSLRHFIASPAIDRIAVWGDHKAIWTGAGREGLKLLMQMYLNRSKSILVGRSYQDFHDDFGTKYKKC